MGWLVLNGHVTIDGIMFDNSFSSPFVLTVGFLRAKASVLPFIFDDVVMHEAFKGNIFEFIGHRRTSKWTFSCEYHPRICLVCCNVKDLHTTYKYYEEVPMEGNAIVCKFSGTRLFSRASESFNGGLVV